MSSGKIYPECEKLAKVRNESQTIGEFLEWLMGTKEVILAKYQGKLDTLTETRESIESLLAEFFGIDLKKVEKERRQMIEDIRNAEPKSGESNQKL